jgi:hypothetical protein
MRLVRHFNFCWLAQTAVAARYRALQAGVITRFVSAYPGRWPRLERPFGAPKVETPGKGLPSRRQND